VEIISQIGNKVMSLPLNQKMHCLLIDDDVDDCEIFALALSGLDDQITTETICEASDALWRLESKRLKPDIVFVDLNMPRTDGMTCLKRIRSMPGLQGMPVIIYSTSTNPRDIEACRKEGATGYLIKPSSIASLRSELVKLFEKHYDNIFAS